ncbi:BT3A3 protein, partial [Atractosteus spatula]|nr:BT3A3 protein [Atractosteus spatula]
MEVRWYRQVIQTPVHLYEDGRDRTDVQDRDYRSRTYLDRAGLHDGDLSLKLNNLQVSDNGLYNCLATDGLWYGRGQAELVVRALGSQPTVTLNGTEAEQPRLLCRSEDWHPPPALTWADGHGNDVTALSSTAVERDSRGFLRVSSHIPVRPQSGVFACLLRSTAPESDGETQVHVSKDFFPAVSGWAVTLFIMLVLAVAALPLLVIQWRRMNTKDWWVNWLLGKLALVQVLRCPAMQSLIGEHEDFKVRTEFDRKPVQGLQDRSNVSTCTRPEGIAVQEQCSNEICSSDPQMNMRREYRISAHVIGYSFTSMFSHVKQCHLLSSILSFHVRCFLVLLPTAAVTLDPDTAHGELTLSEDGMKMRVGGWHSVPDSPHRFDYWDCAVSRQGFTSGRHYWEVESNSMWTIGVSRESAERKGMFSFTPQEGYWGLETDSSSFCALTAPQTPLPLRLLPKTLGVCVDMEERQVSFYNVESRAHIYTFAAMDLREGEKIYPFFRTLDWNKDLVLLSPQLCTSDCPLTPEAASADNDKTLKE